MKQQKLLIILMPILCALLAIMAYLRIVNVSSDAIKFKNEYETLNGEKTSSNKEYKKLSISKNNPIKYSDYDELIDIIENKTGIIYLGFPDCPWCRSALPVLLEAAEKNNIDTIYYMNIKNERDSYTIEDGKLTYALDKEGKEIKGTKGYFKLLKALDKYLSDYVINFEDKDYEVGEKRIFAPSVIFVRDGKILGIQVSTVETHTDPYKSLTKEEHDELYSIYEDFILELSNDSCSIGSSC